MVFRLVSRLLALVGLVAWWAGRCFSSLRWLHACLLPSFLACFLACLLVCPSCCLLGAGPPSHEQRHGSEDVEDEESDEETPVHHSR